MEQESRVEGGILLPGERWEICSVQAKPSKNLSRGSHYKRGAAVGGLGVRGGAERVADARSWRRDLLGTLVTGKVGEGGGARMPALRRRRPEGEKAEAGEEEAEAGEALSRRDRGCRRGGRAGILSAAACSPSGGRWKPVGPKCGLLSPGSGAFISVQKIPEGCQRSFSREPLFAPSLPSAFVLAGGC